MLSETNLSMPTNLSLTADERKTAALSNWVGIKETKVGDHCVTGDEHRQVGVGRYEVFLREKIEKVLGVYNGKILTFEIENYTIKVGDVLIIETQENRFYKKPILTIQLDGVDCPELSTTKKKH